jgi:hypothetical protein
MLVTDLDALAEPFSTALKGQLKKSSGKQDIEKHNEIVKGLLRVLVMLAPIASERKCSDAVPKGILIDHTVGHNTKFHQFVKELADGKGEFSSSFIELMSISS